MSKPVHITISVHLTQTACMGTVSLPACSLGFDEKDHGLFMTAL